MAKCKTCHSKETECTCHDSSCKPVKSSCVINESPLTCLNFPENTSLDVILEAIDSFLCGFLNIPLLSCVKDKLGVDVNVETVTQLQLLNLIQTWICNYSDQNVKITPSDTATGFLKDKIALGDCLVSSVIADEFGVQQLKISLDFPCIITKIPTCFSIESNQCVTVDCTTCQGPVCTPQPLTPIITRVGTTLSGTNCNGTLQWYNSNNALVGSGSSFVGASNSTYYAKCANNCGESGASNNITIPVITTYTRVRTARFIKNDCGTNECSIPCIGTSSVFTKTYTSTISQEHADSLAENDETFGTDGQNFANANGSCDCPNCNCTFPVYNANVLKTNATCNGNVIAATGQILITGIANADKFGYSIGAGDYSGVSYNTAITLNNYNQNNIETTPASIKLKSLSTETRIVFRIFNGANNCYRDVVVLMTPPDCSQEQVEIGDISVSCEIDTQTCLAYTIVASSAVGDLTWVDCITGQYQYEVLSINQTRYKCSTIEPVVTNATVTLNGPCS